MATFRWLVSTLGTGLSSLGLVAFKDTGHPVWGWYWVLFWIVLVVGVNWPGIYQKSAIEATLGIFYQQMDFQPELHARCAVWVPRPWPFGSQFYQLTPYLPTPEDEPDGRKGSVQYLNKDEGIVGKAFKTGKLQSDPVEIDPEDPNPDEALFTYLKREWGFKDDQVRRMRKDRRFYAAVPIKSGSGSILAVLYCDSAIPLGPDEVKRIEGLARFFEQPASTRGG